MLSKSASELPGRENELGVGVAIMSPEEAGRLRSLLSSWLHLAAIREGGKEVRETACALRIWLEDSGASSLQVVDSALEELKPCLEAWNHQSLLDIERPRSISDADTFRKVAARVSPVLLRLSPELIAQIQESTELLSWLRKKKNDREFVTAVEMAMGKGEMECPGELWVLSPGQPLNLES